MSVRKSVGAGFIIAAGVLGAWLAPAAAADSKGACGYYVNSAGHQVPRPCGDWRSEQPPSGATAKCRDGTWSWSERAHASGTCSRHGGVESYR